MLVVAASWAIAPAPLPSFGADATPMFESVALVSVKAASEDPTCEAAATALFAKALEVGAKDGLTEVLSVVPHDLTEPPLTHIICKLTGIPDAPSGAAAAATFLLARPGEGFPLTPRGQQASLTAVLMAVHEVPAEALSVTQDSGGLWADVGVREHDAVLPVATQNARAMAMLRTHVVPWVTRWAPLSSTMPQIQGARITLEVRSEAKKGKNREQFLFRVPAASASKFTVGQLAEPEWIETLQVRVIENLKKPVEKALTLDAEGASTTSAVAGREGIGSIDDLEDE